MTARGIARCGAFSRPPVRRNGALPAALRMYGGAFVRALYWAAGLYAALIAASGAFLTAALLRPERFGSQPGGYTADMLALGFGVALLLLTVFFSFVLAPRAVAMLYAECMRRTFGFRSSDRALLSGAWRETRGRYGTYLAAALFALCLLAGGVPLVRVAAGAFGRGSAQTLGGIAFGIAMVWLLLSFLRLSMPVCIAEGRRGFAAVFRSVGLTAKRCWRVLPRRILYELPLWVVQGALLYPALARFGETALLPCAFALLAFQLLLWPYLAGLDTALYWIAVSDNAGRDTLTEDAAALACTADILVETTACAAPDAPVTETAEGEGNA